MVTVFEQVKEQLPVNSKVLNEEFLFQGTLGQGLHSKVKLAYSLTHKKRVAIKIHKDLNEEQFHSLRKELELLKLLKHENLVKLIGFYEQAPIKKKTADGWVESQTALCVIILEYCQG